MINNNNAAINSVSYNISPENFIIITSLIKFIYKITKQIVVIKPSGIIWIPIKIYFSFFTTQIKCFDFYYKDNRKVKVKNLPKLRKAEAKCSPYVPRDRTGVEVISRAYYIHPHK